MDARNILAQQYLNWLSNYSPEVYAKVIAKLPPMPSENMGQFEIDPWNMYPASVSQPTTTTGTTPEVPWWQTAIDTIKDVGTAYLQWDAQKDILDVQKSRVQQGLPPIQTDLLAPTVRVQADIPPEYRASISSGFQQVLLWGGIGLAAYLLLRAM
jgi:hypothetical protein